MSFTSIPILNMALANDAATKPAFLSDLRHALLEVGFLYLKNVGIPDELFKRTIEEGKAFFDIPEEEKLKIEMKNAPSFLGYSRLSAEVTAGAVDHREQIDLSTPHPIPLPSAPRYHNLLAPNQWPSASVLPQFRPTFEEYMSHMGSVSLRFTSLIAEAIGLPATAFDRYFDQPPLNQQHKLKIVKYPDVPGDGSRDNQGVGPHKDSMLTSYLLQASRHKGLQVQNVAGEWIDCPPIDGTLVVAIGQGMEALTRGVCVSTTHRVLSPPSGQGARYSIPFFQGVRGDAEFEELETVGVGEVPEEVREQRRQVVERNGGGRLDDVEFTFRVGGKARTLGEATLRNRVKSHPDVGERWYPDILAEIREEQAAAAGKKSQGAGEGAAESEREEGAPIVEAKAVQAH
ncbi:2OG-Fe(II) oxygenase superfamily protein [Coniochaeta sp. 2T2.1]|nr:2OG-Fe(II) oxygenase superfamily protein [Coniochaeta sp. 2T2.1]